MDSNPARTAAQDQADASLHRARRDVGEAMARRYGDRVQAYTVKPGSSEQEMIARFLDWARESWDECPHNPMYTDRCFWSPIVPAVSCAACFRTRMEALKTELASTTPVCHLCREETDIIGVRTLIMGGMVDDDGQPTGALLIVYQACMRCTS